MGDRSVKGKWHPRRKQKGEKGRMKKPRIGFRRIYDRCFSVAPLLSSGRCRSQGGAVSDVTGCLVQGRHPLACPQPRFYL